jgi:flavodoxin
LQVEVNQLNEDMKTAIIYTSKHGTTARVAQMIAGRLTHIAIRQVEKCLYSRNSIFRNSDLSTTNFRFVKG